MQEIIEWRRKRRRSVKSGARTLTRLHVIKPQVNYFKNLGLANSILTFLNYEVNKQRKSGETFYILHVTHLTY